MKIKQSTPKTPKTYPNQTMTSTTIIGVPAALAYLIAVNVTYEVMLCLDASCHRAVSPTGIVEHLRRFHKTPPTVRRQVQGFIQGLPWRTYNYSSVRLPPDGLPPQPVLPV